MIISQISSKMGSNHYKFITYKNKDLPGSSKNQKEVWYPLSSRTKKYYMSFYLELIYV